eukprot:16429503-Heterocapsa_arctica.AAC.1
MKTELASRIAEYKLAKTMVPRGYKTKIGAGIATGELFHDEPDLVKRTVAMKATNAVKARQRKDFWSG